jgi:hypothetical protein
LLEFAALRKLGQASTRFEVSFAGFPFHLFTIKKLDSPLDMLELEMKIRDEDKVKSKGATHPEVLESRALASLSISNSSWSMSSESGRAARDSGL